MNGIAIDERRLIRASAGTGKTYQLTNRYISRLLLGVSPAEILAVTFTRNAAAEILDRVLVRLAAAADNDQAALELGDAIGSDNLDSSHCRDVLAGIVDTLQQLRVSTLDSYFSQVATSFSLELGLPTPWQILDDHQARGLKREAVGRLVHSGSNTTLQRLVNLMTSSDSARSIEDSMVRIVSKLHDVYCETQPDAWKWLSPPPRSTNDQIEAAVARLADADWPDGKRWDSARDEAVELVSRRDWQRLVSVGIGKKLATDDLTFYRKEIPATVVDAFEPAFGLLRTDTSNDLADQTAATFEILEMFDAQYSELKRQRRCVEFDDITRVLANASLGSQAARLSHRLNATVDHLLLDEFQDTSSQQWQVLEPLAQDITQGSQQRSFFCVGDEKQAIYGWRGGVAGIFSTLEDRLDGITPDDLKISYRSATPVIETINDTFTKANGHNDLEDLQQAVLDWTSRYVVHETHHVDRPGYTCLRSLPGNKREGTRDLDFDLIAEIIGESPQHGIGILVRQNKTVGEIVTQLRRRGVAASQEGGFPLTDSAPVLVLLALARLADHPADSLAAFHVANSPLAPHLELDPNSSPVDFARISRSLRNELCNRGYGHVLGRYARLLAPAANLDERYRLAQFVRLSTRYDLQATLRPSDFDRFVQHERFGDPSTDSVRVMTVHQAKGLEFDVVILPELDSRFAGRTDLLAVQRPDPTAPPDRVLRTRDKTIRTALDKDIQAVYQADRNRNATEALCVMYVAMTRARYALHMLIPASTKKETKDNTLPVTAAGLLQAALCGGEPVEAGKVLAERGDPKWHTHCHLETTPQPDSLPLDLTLEPITDGRRRGRGRRAPSGLEGHAHTDVAAIFETTSNANRQHGTLVHAWLEAITWADQVPDDERLEDISRRQQIHVDDLEQRIAGLRTHLAKPEILALFSEASYHDPDWLPFDKLTVEADQCEIEVHNEYPFAIDWEDGLLHGTIDRLVLLRHNGQVVAADTIDFKTDHLEDQAEMDAKVEFYGGQLQAYRDAVATLFQLDNNQIATRLAFLGPGRVVDV